MKNWMTGIALGLLLSPPFAPALVAFADGPRAALVHTNVKGLEDWRMEDFWQRTRAALGRHYALLPDAIVQVAFDKAKAAGCEGEACLVAVKQETGAPVVLHLRHVAEGYAHSLYLTRLGDAGAVQKKYICSRCTPQEFEVDLDRLAGKFEEHHD